MPRPPQAPKPSFLQQTMPMEETVTQHGSFSQIRDNANEAWALVRYTGEPLGETVILSEEGITLGRSSHCGLRLMDADVSREHARIERLPGADGMPVFQVEDLGSTNGTFVNGKRLGEQEIRPLRPGDVVRLSGHLFKFKHLDALEYLFHGAMLLQATLDPLTGLCNRATVLHHLKVHAELARRYNRPLSVILCDLDHFKDVNDTKGHAAGDQVLRAVGALLLKRLRASDQVGRLGGEEFVMLLPETPGKEAKRVAESLRKALELESVKLPEGETLWVTASFGVASLVPEDEEVGVLLARADQAMYRAKAQGRNRVETETLA